MEQTNNWPCACSSLMHLIMQMWNSMWNPLKCQPLLSEQDVPSGGSGTILGWNLLEFGVCSLAAVPDVVGSELPFWLVFRQRCCSWLGECRWVYWGVLALAGSQNWTGVWSGRVRERSGERGEEWREGKPVLGVWKSKHDVCVCFSFFFSKWALSK